MASKTVLDNGIRIGEALPGGPDAGDPRPEGERQRDGEAHREERDQQSGPPLPLHGDDQK